MYSKIYSELFYTKLDYNWQEKSRIKFINKGWHSMKRVRIISGYFFIFLEIILGLYTLVPLMVFFMSFVIGVTYYLVVGEDRFTSSATNYYQIKYKSDLEKIITKNIQSFSENARDEYLNLLLSESEKAISKREDSYNKVKATIYAYIVPSLIFIFTLFASGNYKNNLFFKLLITPNYSLSLLALIIVLLVTVSIYQSRQNENSFLLETSIPYWKHKTINKLVLDQKFQNIISKDISSNS